MWVACSHQGSYSLKLHTFSGQKLPERNESHLLLSLLGLFVSLSINLPNIHPNLQLYCQNWVHKVLQVLSWDHNQGAHLSGPRCIPCHPVGVGSTVFTSSFSRGACPKVRTSCLWRTAQDSTPPLFWLYAFLLSCPNPVLRDIFLQISHLRPQWLWMVGPDFE